jgi:hypothetical protein
MKDRAEGPFSQETGGYCKTWAMPNITHPVAPSDGGGLISPRSCRLERDRHALRQAKCMLRS